MALNFPSSPTLNQTYTVSNKTWRWNGSAWDLNPADLATANAAYATANAAYATANTSAFSPTTITSYGGVLIVTNSGISILDKRIYKNRPLSEFENDLISTLSTTTFNDQIGSPIPVSRHFVCNNATESTFTLPSANDVSQGFNLTFDIVNSGNLIFEVASNTEFIRFGPNRVTEVRFVNMESLTSDTLGTKQFNETTTGISSTNNGYGNTVLTFSGQQNIYSLKFIRINSTDYVLSR